MTFWMIFTMKATLLTTNDFTMNTKKYYNCLILGFIFSVLGNFAFADYASRMKDRLPALVQAKDQGVVGEGTDGFVYVRESGSEKIAKMVADENEDRKILFKAMSSKTGGSVEEVANKFSKALVLKSKKGHWCRRSSGEWMQRK